ncbi:hypothetical protein CORC01_05348 [Colletotrichum orchidophilum]|uniref:Membrane fusion mating protein FIG1 n=1 Tax=Colletotrichum orchidophilum TaxID=1209926 RepID=A0A1G4BD70_9PEZI|nr:uncharacterized protein CORC01_05348 [Colletotrichum orchidophilum]OHE99307.1 hypothetical protein CORC01_05348 [Colletotrichum orchidophilum]
MIAAILLAGCTAENLNEICLVSLSYSGNSTPTVLNTTNTISNFSSTATTDNSLEIRVGYFGMCLMSSDQWICSKDSRALESFASRTQTGVAYDPLKVISAAERFKDEVIFKGLHFISIIFGFATFILLATFPNWYETENSEGSSIEIKPFPSRPISHVALACVFVSALISLLATFWQHLSSSAAIAMSSAFTQGAVTGHVGAASMALGWTSVFLLMVTFIGLLVMILAIRVLSQMVD